MYSSNKIRVSFQPQFIIWPDFDSLNEYFYLKDDSELVRVGSNIHRSKDSSYYCVYGVNEYVTAPGFLNNLLYTCTMPYLSDILSSIDLKIVEILPSGKYSFSNSITILLKAMPLIKTINP